MTLSLPFRQLVSCVVATVSARTKAVRSWTRRKRTRSNTAPTAPMHLIRCISGQRSFLIGRYFLLQQVEYYKISSTCLRYSSIWASIASALPTDPFLRKLILQSNAFTTSIIHSSYLSSILGNFLNFFLISFSN